MSTRRKNVVIKDNVGAICKLFLENEAAPEPVTATAIKDLITATEGNSEEHKPVATPSDLHKTGVAVLIEKHASLIATATEKNETGVVLRNSPLATATRPASRIPRIATKRNSGKYVSVVEPEAVPTPPEINQQDKIIGINSEIGKSVIATATVQDVSVVEPEAVPTPPEINQQSKIIGINSEIGKSVLATATVQNVSIVESEAVPTPPEINQQEKIIGINSEIGKSVLATATVQNSCQPSLATEKALGRESHNLAMSGSDNREAVLAKLCESKEAITEAKYIPHELESKPIRCFQCGEAVNVSLRTKRTMNLFVIVARFLSWLIRFFHLPLGTNSGDRKKYNCPHCGTLLGTFD